MSKSKNTSYEEFKLRIKLQIEEQAAKVYYEIMVRAKLFGGKEEKRELLWFAQGVTRSVFDANDFGMKNTYKKVRRRNGKDFFRIK